MNRLSLSIRFFGFLDVLLILWMLWRDFEGRRIPLYDELRVAVQSVRDFGGPEALMLTVIFLSFIILNTVFLSGFLMLRLNANGIYLSFLQAPFRAFLLIQPTFFFLAPLMLWLGFGELIAWSVLLLGEVVKIYIQVCWLKVRKSSATLRANIIPPHLRNRRPY